MNVLIDNSTYNSFRMAIEENLLDAHIIYNMANFLECVVVADKVFLAPTIIPLLDLRKPNPLFTKDGPCIQLTAIASDEAVVAGTLKKAITESIRDLSGKAITDLSTVTHADRNKTHRLLESWQVEVDKAPLDFMKTYSVPVYLTDAGTSKLLNEAFPGYRKAMHLHHHLAHYLLRCNVAMEMAERLVYHPHSHRTPLVCEKMALNARQSASLASALIRDAEGVIEDKISAKAREAFLLPYKLFSSQDTDLPLVLAVVLSGAKMPDDIIPNTIALRDTDAARTYRRWMTELVNAFRSGDPSERDRAAENLLEARAVLVTELSKLYDVRSRGDRTPVSRLISAVPDPEEIASASARRLLIKAGKEIVRSTPRILKSFHNMRVRRKVTLIINLAKNRREIDNLDSLLERTFHKRLEPGQLQALNALRTNQAKLMAQLIQDEN